MGNGEIVTPLQYENKVLPDPGLPDIAIIMVSEDFQERLENAAAAEGIDPPESKWVDLDRDDLVNIPYGPTVGDDKMLNGNWLITGLRGERSGVGKLYYETNGIEIDRIYKRSEYEYYGIFVDEVDGSRAQSRSWKGTSGGGVWQQRLTQAGRRKVEQFSPSSLTPEDLEPPILGGIAFFHETRKSPNELRGDLGGTTYYHGELYAHRVGGMLLDTIRHTLREGIKATKTRKYEATVT